VGTYSDQYLEQYWPERPSNPDMWRDNLELLQAYFTAAEEILSAEGHPVDALDISTGPCLAPLMATMRCMSSVRLSDYDASNRAEIVNSRIDYWAEYARELVRMFPSKNLSVDELLARTDQLRRQHEPLDVDLRRDPIFIPEVGSNPGLLTMHFVVDSICDTVEECFQLLAKAVPFIRPSGWLLLSALINSEGWSLGKDTEPSPNLTETMFDVFLSGAGFQIVSRTRSVRKQNQTYSGGWTVFLARYSAV